jgi:hypothetical protein
LNLGYGSLELGQWERAETFAFESLAVAGSFGLPWVEALAWVILATAEFMQGRGERAAEASRRALALAGGLGPYLAAIVWMNLAFVEAFAGDADAARSARAAAEAPAAASGHPDVAEMLALTDAACELGAAREAHARGDHDEARRRFARARAAAAPRRPGGRPEASDPRIVRRLLAIAVDDLAPAIEGAPRTSAPDRDVLRVHVGGRWFAAPGRARVSLASRPLLRRMLLALAAGHARTRGTPLSQRELLDAGWPGERVGPDAARRRLQVAMWRLREIGLRRLLRADADGYLLDPTVAVELVSEM